MNNITMNGRLIHKAVSHKTKTCEVEKWITISHHEFEKLKAEPFLDTEVVSANKDLMYEDEKAAHCIMLMDEEGTDGLLVQADGYDSPRYSMFVPDATMIYEQQMMTQSERDIHTIIKNTADNIAELAHTGTTDFCSTDMVDLDEVKSLVTNALIQRLAQREDIAIVENIDIGIDFQPDIKVEANPMEEIKFYCPLKIINYPRICLEAEKVSNFEATEYESEINKAIKNYQSDCEENRGLMAYLDDNKQFCDKVYSIFPSVEVVENSLMGVFTCQVYGELKSYELEALREELIGQASDGWGEGFEQRAIDPNSDDEIYVSFYSGDDDWEMMTEEEMKGDAPLDETVDMKM